MIFHENCLPADNSHEISCLICSFEKAAKFDIDICCKLKVALYGLIGGVRKKYRHFKALYITMVDGEVNP